MKLKIIFIHAAILIFTANTVKAQVWYPEGVYPNIKPQVMMVDNQLICAGRLTVDLNNSYWLVSVFDGKLWYKLPLLTMNRAAEVLDIKRYKGLIYLSGNFTFGVSGHCGLVRFNGTAWEGLAEFRKAGNLNGTVNALSVYENNLLIGGNFIGIGNDTMPYLIKYNGSKFAKVFDCKGCEPDNSITDIVSNDTVVAVSGTFTKFKGMKSKYLARVVNGLVDTFTTTPRVIEKLALLGENIFATAGLVKDKRLYKITDVFTEINYNLDSAYSFSEILVWNNQLLVSGSFRLNTSANSKMGIARLLNQTWTDISNNFKGAELIATGRGVLFAAGENPDPVSIWNPNRSVMRFYPAMCLVKAKAFIDSNNNCIRESIEKPVSKTFIRLPGNRGVYTTENGLSEFMMPNEVVSSYRFVVKPIRNLVRSNCADTSVTKTFSPGQYLDSIQFPLNRIPNINDIRVSISSPKGREVVKDKRVVYYLNYQNMGSSQISGKIYLRKSKYFNSEYSVPALSKLNDSTLSWDYSNLQPGESKMIVYSGLASSAEFADKYRFDAGVSSQITSGTTQYPEDDSDSIPQQVNSSLSAFRKDVFPTPDIGDSVTYIGYYDRQLTYNISFNNFSTDTVFYAVVIDTLDLNLDMSFIQETGSNKPYYTELRTDPDNPYRGIIIWHFPNIRLAPNPGMDYESQNSGSYIGFKVVTKPLSNGYTLKNVASVYYDNQYAGTTNAVYVKLSLNSLDELNVFSSMKVYPNPTSSEFTLNGKFRTGDRLMIYSSDGRLISSEIVSEDGQISLDASSWSQGVYRLMMLTAGGILQAGLILNH